MLSPKKVKFRKQMKGRRRGIAWRGSSLTFGEYGLQATGNGWVNAKEIEAARIAMTRYVKRGGRVWIRIFPDKPITKKPAEVRMGKGKGAPEGWVAVVRPGRILYEMQGVPREGHGSLPAGGAQAFDQDEIYREERIVMNASEIRELTVDEMQRKLSDLKQELFNLRFQHEIGQLENPRKIKQTKQDVARLQTVIRAAALNSQNAKA